VLWNMSLQKVEIELATSELKERRKGRETRRAKRATFAAHDSRWKNSKTFLGRAA